MDDDNMETLTQNDEELIDHVLLKKINNDAASNGSGGPKDFKKLTSRRHSG
jgi:hypothetical protein